MAAAKGTPLPAAAAIDAVLHRGRLKHGRKRVHPIPAPVPALPDGAVVVAAGSAFTLGSGLAHRWTNEGYDPCTLRQGLIDHRTHSARPSFRSTKASSWPSSSPANTRA